MYYCFFLSFLMTCCSLNLPSDTANNHALIYHHFKVTEKEGQILTAKPIAATSIPQWAYKISQQSWDWSKGPNPETPYFKMPVPFVLPPNADSGEPFYSHNHCPSMTWLNNGDLLAIWYSTKSEQNTELTVLASRRRANANHWDPSSEFFKAESHNMHASSLFRDAQGVLYHFNGMGAKDTPGWGNLALLLRTSTDNGVTWSPPQVVGPEYRNRQMPISGAIITQNGVMIQACDADPGANGGTALHISKDGGQNWHDFGRDKPAPNFQKSATGQGTIAGIHAGIIELKDGRLMALGRGDSINDRMPMSISDDLGKTWTYSASPFPPIDGGQRLILKRLNEGPILLISFTNSKQQDKTKSWSFTDANGNSFEGIGMYATLSFDEGQTWPIRKLLTPGNGNYNGGAWTGKFKASPTRAEHAGYLAVTQTPDNIIHLISSRLYYQFNLKWLTTMPSTEEFSN